MKFTLKLNFTNDQLEVIAATNSKVIVAKPSNSGPYVAWQAFDPLNANTLTWEEEYGVYASTASMTHGAELLKLSNTGTLPATSNKVYVLESSGVISGPQDGGELNSFTLVNQYDKNDFMTVGLYQDAIVNGVLVAGNAISAAGTLLASTAVISPYTTLCVWLQSEVDSNTVVTKVASPISLLKFGGKTSEISAHYDRISGKFL
jgi:hypothetical protein